MPLTAAPKEAGFVLSVVCDDETLPSTSQCDSGGHGQVGVVLGGQAGEKGKRQEA